MLFSNSDEREKKKNSTWVTIWKASAGNSIFSTVVGLLSVLSLEPLLSHSTLSLLSVLSLEPLLSHSTLSLPSNTPHPILLK